MNTTAEINRREDHLTHVQRNGFLDVAIVPQLDLFNAFI